MPIALKKQVWNNLVDEPMYGKVKKELKAKLYKWMAQQGDKGQETELEAFEHQGRYLNKNTN